MHRFLSSMNFAWNDFGVDFENGRYNCGFGTAPRTDLFWSRTAAFPCGTEISLER